MFGYGFLSVVFVLYLAALGLSAFEVGLLLALTLLGDAAVSLWLTTHADRIGRRRVLVAGAGLMLAAGLAFVATPVYAVLVIAATIGVISPSGNEVGPFLAVDVLLILVPLMPTLPLATAVLLFRFSISQMDVPTRQSYTIAIVAPDERSAAAGVTGIARSLGVAASPLIAAPLFLSAAFAWTPFVIAGGIKVAYDLLLYRAFRAHRAPEEIRADR